MGEGEETLFVSPFDSVADPYLQNYTNMVDLLIDKTKEHEEAGKTELYTCAFSGEVVDFGSYEDLTRRIGSALHKRGLRQGDVVIFMAVDIVKQPVFLGGVWRANGIGRASYPEDDAQTLLARVKESRTGWIYCDAMHAPMCLGVADNIYWDVEVIVASREAVDGCTTIYELMEDDGSELPELNLSLDTPALIMCTSGTTGLSKGAVLTHANMIWMTTTLAGGVPLFEDKSNLVFTKGTHISGTLIPFSAIIAGIPLVFLTYITRQRILDAVDKFRPGFIFGFPTFLLLLVHDPEAAKMDLSHIEVIAGGGAPITSAIEKALMALPNLKSVFNLYGLTECVPVITNIDYANYREALQDRPDGAVGKLAPGIYAKFLGLESGQPVGQGEVGELCCKCDGMFREYYLNEEATEKAFDDGYFKTGDVGYINENGFIFLVDREKEIFKYSGNHVSPTEIENIILAHPAIAEVCVIGILDPDGLGHLPRAVCIPVPEATVTPEEIQEYTNDKLANYKHLRGGVFFVKDLPKGKTGKVTRQLVEKLELE